jgi:divalent metal cation (Fe/Co/Zn/Cd) transporter
MRREPDIVSLIAGLVIAVLGVLLLLDQLDALELRFAYGGPALLAAVGAILLANGLGRPRRRS